MKKYISPKMEIDIFEAEDIITVSTADALFDLDDSDEESYSTGDFKLN